MSERTTKGCLIIIGGHEDKEGERAILNAVAQRVQGGKLVVTTVASHHPEGYFESYLKGFEGLGVGELVELDIRERAEAMSPHTVEVLENAAGVFFTGGDQLRIASQIGDTPVYQRMKHIFECGGVVAGTSAGASAMSETMLVGSANGGVYRVGDLTMAPGLALMPSAIIDQHFAERGRIGRLLGAVSMNPRLLGIGLDEDTALIVEGDCCEVIGSGGVYVVDASEVSWSNVSEDRPERTLSLFDVRLHLLGSGDRFDMGDRRPERCGADPVAEARAAA